MAENENTLVYPGRALFVQTVSSAGSGRCVPLAMKRSLGRCDAESALLLEAQ